jgi:hypothetical protein
MRWCSIFWPRRIRDPRHAIVVASSSQHTTINTHTLLVILSVAKDRSFSTPSSSFAALRMTKLKRVSDVDILAIPVIHKVAW